MAWLNSSRCNNPPEYLSCKTQQPSTLSSKRPWIGIFFGDLYGVLIIPIGCKIISSILMVAKVLSTLELILKILLHQFFWQITVYSNKNFNIILNKQILCLYTQATGYDYLYTMTCQELRISSWLMFRWLNIINLNNLIIPGFYQGEIFTMPEMST